MSRRARIALQVTLVVTGLAVPTFLSAAPGAKQGAKPQAAQAEPLPTMEEVRQLFDAADYKGTLQKVSRLLSLRGKAAGAYDQHALLRLKAESHLKLRDTRAAADAFARAAKAAPDEATAAEDTVTAAVVKRSKNLAFTPKAGKDKGPAAPVDISDPEGRKAAFAALLAEQKAELVPKAKAARQSKALPPVIEAMKLVAAFRTTELAATGSDEQSREMTDELAGRAHKLMAEALEDMAAAVDGIEAAANDLREIAVPVTTPGGGASLETSYKRAGLDAQDKKELGGIVADCKKIVPTCREMAEALGKNGGADFEALAEYGAEVGTKAYKVLNTNYDDNYERMNRSGGRLRRPVERR